MAESTCVCCGSSEFEEVLKPSVKGADKAISFVQCANCGGVIGRRAVGSAACETWSIRRTQLCSVLDQR